MLKFIQGHAILLNISLITTDNDIQLLFIRHNIAVEMFWERVCRK